MKNFVKSDKEIKITPEVEVKKILNNEGKV